MHVLKLTKIAQMDQQKVCIILAKNMFTAQACKYFQDRNKKKTHPRVMFEIAIMVTKTANNQAKKLK